ncbi:ATP-binding protein [Acetobacter sacchari]|nr:ATP-binding protein [Acetobacter sacchari]
MKHEAPRLLLVENAATQGLRIGPMLEAYGFEIESVQSGEAALDSLDTWIPLLVVTDFRLPGMDGGQMARQLRLNAATRAVPVLMLTDGHDPKLEREVLLAGIDACVPRSADTSLLAFRIRALLREHPMPQTPSRGMFRRPAVAVATGPGGALMAWGPPVLHVMRESVERLNASMTTLAGKRESGGDAARAADGGPKGVDDSTVYPSAALGRLPVIRLLRGDGMEAMALDNVALASPDLWIDTVDCVIVDLTCPAFDGLALCRSLDARRNARVGGGAPTRLLGFGGGNRSAGDHASDAYAAGVDDLVGADIDVDFLLLHVRALLRRKVLQDESRRSEAERAAREAAMQGARAKAALAEALEQANTELAAANRKLIDAQTKLVQSAKMASLGELVAGIAHEFNNPLAFVLAHEDTVARNLEKAISALAQDNAGEARVLLDKSRDRLGASSVGLGRMRDLVSSLRHFSRLDQGVFMDVNMPEAIGTVLSLLGPKLGDDIAVECAYGAPPVLRCQTALAHQVVMNVISNAVDAFEAEGGAHGGVPRIRIETALCPANDVVVAGSVSRLITDWAGDAYVITVCDNGPGVPPFMRERVFEPFFTTKPVGVGTGLGLATAYGVVQAHGGGIEVGVSPEGGACFTIAVPYRAPGSLDDQLQHTVTAAMRATEGETGSMEVRHERA